MHPQMAGFTEMLQYLPTTQPRCKLQEGTGLISDFGYLHLPFLSAFILVLGSQ